jgi:hypothetical protein
MSKQTEIAENKDHRDHRKHPQLQVDWRISIIPRLKPAVIFHKVDSSKRNKITVSKLNDLSETE